MKTRIIPLAALAAALVLAEPACRRQPTSSSAPQAATVPQQETPADASRFQGECRALVTITERDGRPARGRAYRIEFDDRTAGPLLVRKGRVDDEGRIALEGLAPLDYQVLVDGERLGAFGFEDSRSVSGGTFRLPPMAGDPAPDLQAIDLTTGGTVTLAAFTGQVVWLDFWATWCGPCREPMARVNELAAKRGAEWAGRAALVAVSIDDEPAVVRRTLLIRNLTSLRHLWAGTGAGRRWASDAAVAYGIREIPTGLLIGRDGRIAWRGTPAGFPLEAEIARLLGAP